MEMQNSQRPGISWSDLPTDVVQLIPDFLSKTQDALNFRAVCTQWWCATRISAFLPRSFQGSAIPQTVVSSTVSLVRPLDQSPPWMVLSVEPTKGVTQYFNPFTRTLLQDLPPNLDLAKLRATKLASECHIVGDEQGLGLFCSGSSLYVKALMFFQQSVPSVHNCRLLAIFDGGQLRVKDISSRNSFQKALDPQLHVDDIIRYKGKIYALDKNHILYSSGDRIDSSFSEVVADKPMYDRSGSSRLRKRLAVSSSTDKLFMVDPVIWIGKRSSGANTLCFRISQLKIISNSWRWSEVRSFGDADAGQVLFITRDYCFFVAASEFPGCQLRNCIVFSDDAFPRYSNSKCVWDYGTKVGNEISIFSLDTKVQYSLPVERYPKFPLMLWSPPPWVQSLSKWQREPENDRTKQMKQLAQSSQDGVPGPVTEKLSIETHPADKEKAAGTATTNVGEPHQETLREGMIHYVSTAYITCIKPSDSRLYSTVKFEGLDIRPSLVPTLQKIYSRHGNILEDCLMRNGDTIARALESLATAVLILEFNSARSLRDDQANYLRSVLFDLRFMNFKVDWLAPFIEKAVRLHDAKPLIDSFIKIRQSYNQASEQRATLLDELAKIDEVQAEMKEDLAKLSRMIPYSGELDLDTPLGGALA